MSRDGGGISDPYVRRKCVHYLDPSGQAFLCSAAQELCQQHMQHLPCTFRSHRKESKK